MIQSTSWLSRSAVSGLNAFNNFAMYKCINGFSICPRYGNYLGMDWSGGIQIRSGQIGPDVDPVDQMDAYCKQHDISCYNALKVSSPVIRRNLHKEADHILYDQLKSLPDDPFKWTKPAKNPIEARCYRKMAEWWFGDILGNK